MGQNNPVELGRLGRLVPRFTKSSTVGERMARVRFLQMVQLIPVILVETKKEEYLQRHFFYSGNFFPGWTVPFDISSETGFSVQMVSALDFPWQFLLSVGVHLRATLGIWPWEFWVPDHGNLHLLVSRIIRALSVMLWSGYLFRTRLDALLILTCSFVVSDGIHFFGSWHLIYAH